jgi:1-acyl-sn-glycerol-3-phosphate acyltransferase
MTAIRSILFNVVFYLALVLEMIVFTPIYFLLPRRKAWFVPKFWARSSLWLHGVICGAPARIDGLENLPDGPFILAPKHQSFWDVLAFFPYLRDPLFILKRELMRIPLFGWYVAKMRMVPVDRGERSKALKAVVARTLLEMEKNRQLIIYPEGTRRAPGDVPAYKWGIAELYSRLNVPVVPVVHAAGLFWPRRKFMRYPGVIHARFLPPIEPGLDRQAFLDRLVAETEAGCDAMLVEAAAAKNPPPLPPTAMKRLAELKAQEQVANSSATLPS